MRALATTTNAADKESSRVVIVQPEIPTYRMDFFERLSRAFGDRLTVLYSPGALAELTAPFDAPWARRLGPLRSLPCGLVWQTGLASFAVRKGDIIVVPGNPRLLSSLLLLVMARLRGARVVWWGHYWSSTSRSWRFLLRMALMKGAHAVLFYTDREVAEYFAWSNRRDARPVAALNNGLNLESIRPVRTSYDPEVRTPALLFIGRVTAKARLDLLLEALTLPETRAASLEIIGWGDEVPRLQERAQLLGLGERVRWHGALTDEAAIARIANTCRAFAYPGDVGLSLIHGMAYGLPAIVHADRWRHMPEIAAFEDGVTGHAFAPGDARSLADAIRVTLESPEMLRRYSHASQARVDADFNTAAMARRFVALTNMLT